MKYANATRAILRFIVALHKFALRSDCKRAERIADRKFDRAAHQLELVNSAKQQLAIMQDSALNARAKSQKLWACASDEVCSLKIGGKP